MKITSISNVRGETGIPLKIASQTGRELVRVTDDGRVQFADDITPDELRLCIEQMAPKYVRAKLT